MTKDERLNMYEEATKKWGWIAQIDQAIEEMAELMIALNKYKRNVVYKEDTDKAQIDENLYTELADVSMCLEQLINVFGEDKVEEKLNIQLAKFRKQIDKQQ
ncbi:MAG: hypothetical protein AB7S44_02985 [Spirochaetales bacterium]